MNDNELIAQSMLAMKHGQTVELVQKKTIKVTSPDSGESVHWLLDGEETPDKVALYVGCMCDHLQRKEVDKLQE